MGVNWVLKEKHEALRVYFIEFQLNSPFKSEDFETKWREWVWTINPMETENLEVNLMHLVPPGHGVLTASPFFTLVCCAPVGYLQSCLLKRECSCEEQSNATMNTIKLCSDPTYFWREARPVDWLLPGFTPWKFCSIPTTWSLHRGAFCRIGGSRDNLYLGSCLNSLSSLR